MSAGWWRLWLQLGLCVALALCGCSRPAPEEQLRQAVSGIEKAIEQHDASAVRDAIADDFVGPEGLDRDGVRRLMAVTFLQYRELGVSLGPLDVELTGAHARVRCTAVVTGGSGAFPSSGQIYDVETGWRLVDGEWQLVNARWEPRL